MSGPEDNDAVIRFTVEVRHIGKLLSLDDMLAICGGEGPPPCGWIRGAGVVPKGDRSKHYIALPAEHGGVYASPLLAHRYLMMVCPAYLETVEKLQTELPKWNPEDSPWSMSGYMADALRRSVWGVK